MLRIVIMLVVLLVVFAVYELVGLIRKKAVTYYVGEDGTARPFGGVSYSVATNGYHFRDYTQPRPNRYQGFSNVEDGRAVISLRKDPSASDLSGETAPAGWVDLAGNIYGTSGLKLGYITDAKGRPGIAGSGKWYELWLRKHSYVFSCPPLASEDGDATAAADTLVGKVVETGRLGRGRHNTYTITARAGGFLLLYKDRQPRPESEDALDPAAPWKDTALPAAVLFAIVYGIVCLAFPGWLTFPGRLDQSLLCAAMLGAYLLIWALLRQVKVEASLDGRRFDDFLMLVNRNTGLVRLNNWIILGAGAALLLSVYLSAYIFVPLLAVILIGAWVNNRYITHEPWLVLDTEEGSDLPDWDGEDGGEGEGPSFAETDERTFRWSLDSPFHRLDGELTLRFDRAKIEELRRTNPFRENPTAGFKSNVTALFDRCRDNANVHRVLRYVNRTVREAGLGELEQMQFILDFVQAPNITYRVDEKCEEIGNPRDYARFPDETMYDGRGDCDCKAVLAAALFKEAGFKTAYLTTETHAAVAVAFKSPAAKSLTKLGGSSLLTNDGYMYFFCETTGDGFRIGDLGSTRREAIRDIIFLN